VLGGLTLKVYVGLRSLGVVDVGRYRFSPFDRRKISNQDARTPEDLYRQLDEEFHFDFDPCPNNPTFDGLKVEWGKSNYVNPPYANKTPWILKAIEESRKGKTVVMLLPVDTSTRWFHDLILTYADEIRFIRGRLRFSQSSKVGRRVLD
jgi:site-specific DNA-methyltransferase (adenine-specific)